LDTLVIAVSPAKMAELVWTLDALLNVDSAGPRSTSDGGLEPTMGRVSLVEDTLGHDIINIIRNVWPLATVNVATCFLLTRAVLPLLEGMKLKAMSVL